MVGSFDSPESPAIAIEVSGFHHDHRASLKAVIDTGFTGFLLPILEAFPVGLVLHSTMGITLADGSTQQKLACLGHVHFESEVREGVILVEEQNTDVLVGMEFLRIFGLRLIVDAVQGRVELLPSPSGLPE